MLPGVLDVGHEADVAITRLRELTRRSKLTLAVFLKVPPLGRLPVLEQLSEFAKFYRSSILH